ncbi:MAG TPA: co-chaperone GroES [Actinomycetota bacterium]|jgi:chaperonin GroES|nr:co-chaperone GroES [Actinomycetota bacterium]
MNDPSAVRAVAGDDHRSAPIKVLSDRVLLRVPEADGERRTKTGLLIPATAATVSRRCIWAEVVAVGPHVRQIEAGDLALILPESGVEVEIRGDEYMLVREREIHAVAADRVPDPGTGLYL